MTKSVFKNYSFVSKAFLGLMLAFSSLGCSLFQKQVDVSPLPPRPELKVEQQKALKEADDDFLKKNYKSSFEKYEIFVKKYPQSIFVAQAELGIAMNYMAVNQYQKAVEAFRSVANLTKTSQPTMAAKALYSSSYCYEMLGDDVHLMATLKDTEKLSDHLADDVRMAELPARLASIHYRLGSKVEADKYFQQADRGMIQLKAKMGGKLDRVWAAKTYFQMGGLTTSQLSADGLAAHFESLIAMQYFILRAIEEDGDPWAQNALENLRRNYMDIWNTIQSWPKDPNLDPVAAEKNRARQKGQLMSELLTTMERLRNFMLPDSQEKNLKIKELLVYLSELEIKARDFIYSSDIYNELTPDSQRRSGLRREGVIRAK